jgi:hypothetical protein
LTVQIVIRHQLIILYEIDETQRVVGMGDRVAGL